MPYYIFQHPDNQEVKEIFQHMNDNHVYSENNVKWLRLFTIPQASVDSSLNINPLSPKEYVEKTGKKTGTYGDLVDLSKELSEKREKIQGKDTVREAYYKKHFKEKRKLHPAQKKELLKESFKNNKNFSLEI